MVTDDKPNLERLRTSARRGRPLITVSTGNADEFLHFERSERWSSGQHLYLHVGDVRDSVDRQLLGGSKAERSDEQHAQDDERSVSNGEID